MVPDIKPDPGPAYIGQRVVWTVGSRTGRRGTVIAPRVKIAHTGAVRMAVEWDDDDEQLHYYWPPNWGQTIRPLPTLDALAELGSAAR